MSGNKQFKGPPRECYDMNSYTTNVYDLNGLNVSSQGHSKFGFSLYSVARYFVPPKTFHSPFSQLRKENINLLIQFAESYWNLSHSKQSTPNFLYICQHLPRVPIPFTVQRFLLICFLVFLREIRGTKLWKIISSSIYGLISIPTSL